MSTIGFVKLQRTDTTDELLNDTKALHLLTVVALRARYTDEPSLQGLTYGQAFIGDDDRMGLTRAERRCAEQRLMKWRLCEFKGTPRGTVATLLDSRVFSLRDERESLKNSQQNNQQNSQPRKREILQNAANETASPTAIEQPTHSQLTATNKNERRKEGAEGIPEGGRGVPPLRSPLVSEDDSPNFFDPSLDSDPETLKESEDPPEGVEVNLHVDPLKRFKDSLPSMYSWTTFCNCTGIAKDSAKLTEVERAIIEVMKDEIPDSWIVEAISSAIKQRSPYPVIELHRGKPQQEVAR